MAIDTTSKAILIQRAIHSILAFRPDLTDHKIFDESCRRGGSAQNALNLTQLWVTLAATGEPLPFDG